MNTFEIVLPVQKLKIGNVTSYTRNETQTEKWIYKIHMRFNFPTVITWRECVAFRSSCREIKGKRYPELLVNVETFTPYHTPKCNILHAKPREEFALE